MHKEKEGKCLSVAVHRKRLESSIDFVCIKSIFSNAGDSLFFSSQETRCGNIGFGMAAVMAQAVILFILSSMEWRPSRAEVAVGRSGLRERWEGIHITLWMFFVLI